jgi:hypothetical protein
MVKRALLAVLLAGFSIPIAHAETLKQGEKTSVPAGTMLHCRVTQTITTKLNFQGDSFAATISEPVLMDGHEVIPVGATLEGRIVQLTQPGRVKGVAEMRLTAEKITFADGRSVPLNATLLTAYGADGAKVVGSEGTVKGPSVRRKDLAVVGGATTAGGLVGMLFNHPWIGATVGGTAALVDRLRRRGPDLTIPSGTQLNYQLTRPLEVDHEASNASLPHPAKGAGN